MTNEIKEILEALKSHNDIVNNDIVKEYPLTLSIEEQKLLLDYITNLQEENKIIDKIKKLRNANTYVENIYYAEGVLLNEPYCDIEDVDNEELLDILRGDE